MIFPWLIKYAEEVIDKYNFDSSHDMQHFQNVYNYSKDIVDNDYPYITLIENISREDSLIILYNAAFCHDLIDDKYVDSKKAIKDLKNMFLINGYNEEHLDIIIFLISNMSFSKQRFGVIVPEKYQLILNILSDADKLDAYRPERVVAYQERKNTDAETTKSWIKTILVKRVLKYKDEWLQTDYSKKICVEMHNKVQKYVEDNYKNVEMLEY